MKNALSDVSELPYLLGRPLLFIYLFIFPRLRRDHLNAAGRGCPTAPRQNWYGHRQRQTKLSFGLPSPLSSSQICKSAGRHPANLAGRHQRRKSAVLSSSDGLARALKVGMPLGIDPALAQSLKDIDPEHLNVSH